VGLEPTTSLERKKSFATTAITVVLAKKFEVWYYSLTNM